MNYTFHRLRITSSLPLPELPRSRFRGEVSIDCGGAPGRASREWFHQWQVGGRRWLSFAREAGGNLLRFHRQADFEILDEGRRIVCHPVPGLPNVTLRHLLLDQVMPMVLSRRSDRLVLHASAVHVPGYGTIGFAGPAGAGKSTMAAALAQRGCAIVSDDCLAVSLDGSSAVVAPGYPGLRLWQDSLNALKLAGDGRVAPYTSKRRVRSPALEFRVRDSRLRTVVVLGKRRTRGSPTVTTSPGPRDQLIAIAPYACVLDVGDRDQLAAMFAQLFRLVERVPVCQLSVRSGRSQMPAVAAEVLTRIVGNS